MTANNGTTTPQAPQTQALTPYQARAMELREEIGQDAAPRALVPRTFAEAQAFASAIAQSSLVPEALRERAPDVLMIVLAGAELGIPPIKALTLYHVMEGVPKLSADGIAAVVMANPLCEYLEPIEQGDDRVTWKTKRVGREEQRLTWTNADVERAGLHKPTRNGNASNHTKYPRAMKNARCKKELCNLVYPEIVAGLVSAEEARDMIHMRELEEGKFTAPPPAPPAPPKDLPRDTTKQGDGTPAGGSSSKAKAPAKPKPPIDAKATEHRYPSEHANGGALNDDQRDSLRSEPKSAEGNSSGSTTTPAAAPSSSASPSGSANAPASSQSSAPDVTSSTSSRESQSSAPVEADAGGDDWNNDPEPAPSSPPPMTIELFRTELAAATKETIDTVKNRWLPWSMQGQPGFAHATEMRTLFAARRKALLS